MARGGSESARARAQESRRTQGSAGLTLAVERQITTLVERILNQRAREQALLLEKLQVLLGERGDQRRDSALRRGELLLNFKRIPRASAAPSMDEFNALVDAYNSLIVALADLARK
ncbi:hypothetical protein [Pseudomonas phage Itty13]|uniref:Uncharacterized protein n=1 Tax=Pseudomonas phage Itty13 TaxID=2805750 RepID=A0A889IR43_9CAUD|nr:hypothetical protein PQC19_gp08 [Pseudomonas phage Itty13]QRE00584.1 hypothetical protein [Pseudomonas phage Itty13]